MNYRLRYRAVLRLAAFLSVFFSTLNAFARPDMTPLGPNIADKGSAYYHFSVNLLDSADGDRHYKVWTGIPDKSPPPGGYPVIYLLDGNAVMDRLSDGLLQQLSAQNPPVLVAIGYQTVEPFELNARSYDYTPPLAAHSGACFMAKRPGRKCGGGKIFLNLLTEEIAPLAEKGVKINLQQRAIWGHSLGGLFVLKAWLSSSFFHNHYTTSPSLNHDYIGLLDKLEKADRQKDCGKRLYFIEGGALPGKNPQAPGSDVLERIRATLAQLNKQGLSAAYWSYPGLTHGQMFDAGFQRALLDMAGKSREEERSCRQ